MDAQLALGGTILARLLREAIRRGDVVVKIDADGVERFSVAEKVGQPSV